MPFACLLDLFMVFGIMGGRQKILLDPSTVDRLLSMGEPGQPREDFFSAAAKTDELQVLSLCR